MRDGISHPARYIVNVTVQSYLASVRLHIAPFSQIEYALSSVTMLLLGMAVGPRNRSESTDKHKMHHRGEPLMACKGKPRLFDMSYFPQLVKGT